MTDIMYTSALGDTRRVTGQTICLGVGLPMPRGTYVHVHIPILYQSLL